MQPSTPIGPELHYRQELDQGRFVLQRCGACRRAIWYPRVLCPHCGSMDLNWFKPSGLGKVHAYTWVRDVAQGVVQHNVALVDLEEGVRLMSRVEGASFDDLQIGQAVQAYVQVNKGSGMLLFAPVVGNTNPAEDRHVA